MPRRNRGRSVKIAPLAKSHVVRGTSMAIKGGDVSGTDMIEKISSAMTGFVVDLSCNPVKWANSRISTVASIYAMYRPISLKLSWKSCCPATTPGAIVYGVSAGENIEKNTGDAALKGLLSTPGAQMFNVWADHTWSIPLNMLPQKLFYVDGSHDIDSEPFRVLACLADVTASPDTALGYLTVEYSYKFVQPTAGQNVLREFTKAFTSSALAAAGEIKFDLGSAAKFASVIFSTIGEAAQAYVTPGVRYGLALTTTAGLYLLTAGGSPVCTSAALAATAFTGAISYLIDTVLPEPTLNCAMPDCTKFGRTRNDTEGFLVVPPVGPSLTPGARLGSATPMRR